MFMRVKADLIRVECTVHSIVPIVAGLQWGTLINEPFVFGSSRVWVNPKPYTRTRNDRKLLQCLLFRLKTLPQTSFVLAWAADVPFPVLNDTTSRSSSPTLGLLV